MRGRKASRQGPFRATRVIDEVARLIALHGAPMHIRSDNGPEFVATALQNWFKGQGSGRHSSSPARRGRTASMNRAVLRTVRARGYRRTHPRQDRGQQGQWDVNGRAAAGAAHRRADRAADGSGASSATPVQASGSSPSPSPVLLSSQPESARWAFLVHSITLRRRRKTAARDRGGRHQRCPTRTSASSRHRSASAHAASASH